MSRRTRVVLLVSNKLRDLAGLAYFKVLLEAQLGLDVRLLNTADWRYMLAYRPHVVMVPSIVNPDSGDFLRFLKRRGMLVVALPTEGVLRCEEEVSALYGNDLAAIRDIDLALLWGEGMAGLLSRFYGLPGEKLAVVGGLRFDFYRPPLSQMYVSSRVALCAELGLNPDWPIVVWATGYPAAERFRERGLEGKDEAAFKSLGVPGLTGLEFVRMQLAAQESAFAAVGALVRNLSRVNLLIKVRPDETTALYEAFRTRLGPDRRIAVVKSTPVFSLVQAADVWLHWNSTTSAEAWFFDRPTVSLLMGAAQQYCVEDMARGSVSTYTDDDLYDAVTRFLKDPAVPLEIATARQAYITRWFHRIDGQAGARHVAAVERLLGSTRVVDPPFDALTVRAKTIASIKRLLGRESYESIRPWTSSVWDTSGLATTAEMREATRRVAGVLKLAKDGACA